MSWCVRKPLWAIQNEANDWQDTTNDGIGTEERSKFLNGYADIPSHEENKEAGELELVSMQNTDKKTKILKEGLSSTKQTKASLTERHLTLFDLVSIGVGGTIGSGIFVLCGLVARDYAGPAVVYSWIIAGIAACFSGCCYAELSGRIPTAGSSYAYAYASMGELIAFLTAACLTLEFLVSGAAVARSWGDKVVKMFFDASADTTSNSSLEDGNYSFMGNIQPWLHMFFDPFPDWGINPCAFFISLASMGLLLKGVKESKFVTGLFTWAKVTLVVFMTTLAFLLFQPSNLQPFIPHEYGSTGVIRGATSLFFGYLGYDGICCVAGEAKNPQRNLPRAVLLTLVLVTLLYIIAALALVGMVPYNHISRESGFPDGFAYHHIAWASHLSAAGEIFTLPIVVFISLMLQPRLQYALACDGLLPPLFKEVNPTNGVPFKGTLVAGLIMTTLATFVPFTYLDDFVSAGILVAFSVTNSSLIMLRLLSPSKVCGSVPMGFKVHSQTHGDCCCFKSLCRKFTSDNAHKLGFLERHLLLFNIFSFLTCICLVNYSHDIIGVGICVILLHLTAFVCLRIWWYCKPCQYFGEGISSNSGCDNKIPPSESNMTEDNTFLFSTSLPNTSDKHLCPRKNDSKKDEGFTTPLMPFLPCLGIFINWFLIAQLEPYGLGLLFLYGLIVTILYFAYSIKHSVGNTRGWRSPQFENKPHNNLVI